MLCDAQLYLDRSQEELRLTAAVLSPFRHCVRLTGVLRFERKEITRDVVSACGRHPALLEKS